MVQVLLGLGANLGDPEVAIRRALDALANDGALASVSRLWRTRAVGPPQPDFVNAAAVLHWWASLRCLLELGSRIECEAGRERSGELPWGPRVLDIDLLLADGVVCRGPALELPHPRFHERRFALEPAAEVAAGWIHPLLGRTVADLLLEARAREADAILGVLSPEF